MNVLIVDDEPIARKGMVKYLMQLPKYQIIGECENVFEAKEAIKLVAVDIMLLDIQMPYITGIDFLKQIGNHKPATIIISAFPNYALEGFDLDVIDYLIKPVGFERFTKALEKAALYIESQKALKEQAILTDVIFLKTTKSIEKVHISDIILIEALHNYIAVYVGNKKIIVYQSLKKMEEMLPPHLFIRVHKSFLVAINKIIVVEDNKLNIGINTWIPISRTHKKSIQDALKNKII